MKRIFLYNVPQALEQLLGASRLMSVATLMRPVGKTPYFSDTNTFPGASLFNGKTVVEAPSGWTIKDETGKAVAFLEKCDGTVAGCEFRWYNNPDRTKATMVRLLVYGDPEIDLIVANPGIEVEKRDGGIVCLKNVTTTNGIPWNEAPGYREAGLHGFHFAVSGVNDGRFGSLRYLLEGNGYNQFGASRKTYVKISNAPAALTKDLTGDTQIADNSVDYVLSVTDQQDPNVEYFNIQHIAAVKNESEVLRIPIAELFN